MQVRSPPFPNPDGRANGPAVPFSTTTAGHSVFTRTHAQALAEVTNRKVASTRQQGPKSGREKQIICRAYTLALTWLENVSIRQASTHLLQEPPVLPRASRLPPRRAASAPPSVKLALPIHQVRLEERPPPHRRLSW